MIMTSVVLAAEWTMAADTPIGSAWWPSRWGAADEAGASNWMTPEKVRSAVTLVKTGKIYRLGRDYEAGMPLFGSRVFALRIPGAPTGGPFGNNKVVWHDEFLATEIGQVGTQFDGLGHIGVATGEPGDKAAMRFYNGVTEAEMATATGLQKLGVEKVKPLVTRGIVLDVAGLKGRMLREGEEITVADLQAALARQGLAETAITPGDAVLIHTGWGGLWMKDNARYGAGQPGIGMEAAKWLAAKQIALVGADNWGVEVGPNPDTALAFPAHQELLTKNGIFLQENLDLAELVADRAWEVLYVFAQGRHWLAGKSDRHPIIRSRHQAGVTADEDERHLLFSARRRAPACSGIGREFMRARRPAPKYGRGKFFVERHRQAMADIFISYAREDLETAKTLAQALAAQGWSVWWDRRIPIGRRFHDVIQRELTAARCVIALWSTAALSSPWVREEAQDGLDRDILVPAKIEMVQLPIGFRAVPI